MKKNDSFGGFLRSMFSKKTAAAPERDNTANPGVSRDRETQEAETSPLNSALARTEGETTPLRPIIADAEGETTPLRPIVGNAEGETTPLRPIIADAEGETTPLRPIIADVEGETTPLRPVIADAEGETAPLRPSSGWSDETCLLGAESPMIPSEEPRWEEEERPNQGRNVYRSSSSLVLVRCSTGERYPLKQDYITLGKDPRNVDICVDSDTVSRHHATITCTDGTYFVMDNKSTNGTTIEGVALQAYEKAELFDGAMISFGSEYFQVLCI